MTGTRRFALGLGGNLGPVRETLTAALVALREHLGPLRVAPLYRTTPASDLPQPDYLNTAAAGATDREARDILALAKALEAAAGRRPGPRWGPRELDVDLLLLGDEVIAAPDLVVPHPRLGERAFVLVPLAAVAADLRVPPGDRTVGELRRGLGEVPGVVRVPWGGEAERRLGLPPGGGG